MAWRRFMIRNVPSARQRYSVPHAHLRFLWLARDSVQDAQPSTQPNSEMAPKARMTNAISVLVIGISLVSQLS
jgi:hypothetical protein